MRRVKILSGLVAAVLPAVLAVACGGAGAGAGEQEAIAKRGFFDQLFASEPEPVVVPAGTVLALRLDNALSSHQTPTGASFSAVVTQEVSVGGVVAVPSGSIVRGHVTEAHPPQKIGGRAILSVSFDALETPSGQTVPIEARLARAGKSEVAKDAAIIGGSTIGGAILGNALDDHKGGTVGAIVGGIAGAIGAKKTEGKPVVLPSGTPLDITLDNSVTLEVQS
jgi:hypothetical protein